MKKETELGVIIQPNDSRMRPQILLRDAHVDYNKGGKVMFMANLHSS